MSQPKNMTVRRNQFWDKDSKQPYARSEFVTPHGFKYEWDVWATPEKADPSRLVLSGGVKPAGFTADLTTGRNPVEEAIGAFDYDKQDPGANRAVAYEPKNKSKIDRYGFVHIVDANYPQGAVFSFRLFDNGISLDGYLTVKEPQADQQRQISPEDRAHAEEVLQRVAEQHGVTPEEILDGAAREIEAKRGKGRARRGQEPGPQQG